MGATRTRMPFYVVAQDVQAVQLNKGAESLIITGDYQMSQRTTRCASARSFHYLPPPNRGVEGKYFIVHALR